MSMNSALFGFCPVSMFKLRNFCFLPNCSLGSLGLKRCPLKP